MLTEKDMNIIEAISRKYNLKRVLLLDLVWVKKSNNIHIWCRRAIPQSFFKFFGDLLLKLSKPIDIIDLKGSSKFMNLVKKEGK